MSNKTVKTDHGTVPKLTNDIKGVWKENIRLDLIAKKAYTIITSVELLPIGNGVALRHI